MQTPLHPEYLTQGKTVQRGRKDSCPRLRSWRLGMGLLSSVAVPMPPHHPASLAFLEPEYSLVSKSYVGNMFSKAERADTSVRSLDAAN